MIISTKFLWIICHQLNAHVLFSKYFQSQTHQSSYFDLIRHLAVFHSRFRKALCEKITLCLVMN